MARQESIVCSHCKEWCTVIVSSGQPKPTLCIPCQQLKHDEDLQEHLDFLNQMTVEERLTRIEKWIFEYKPQHVPAPRF